MKKFLMIALMLIFNNSFAASLEEYAEALDWQEKWEKVVNRTTENYVKKIIGSHFSQLPGKKQKLIASKLKGEMMGAVGWQKLGARYMQNFVDACGGDLLDKFVGFYSGAKISSREKREIASAYRLCAKTAIDKSMRWIDDEFAHRSYNPEKARNSLNKKAAEIIILRKNALRSFGEKYVKARGHKAFAQSDSGNWNWRSNRTSKDHAINNALASCRTRNLEFEEKQPCRIINTDNKWVDIYRQSVTHGRNDESLLMSNKALKSFREKYLDEARNKAFAQSENGSWSWRSSKKSKDDAIRKALSSCRKNNKEHDGISPCRIINANNDWVGN